MLLLFIGLLRPSFFYPLSREVSEGNSLLIYQKLLTASNTPTASTAAPSRLTKKAAHGTKAGASSQRRSLSSRTGSSPSRNAKATRKV